MQNAGLPLTYEQKLKLDDLAERLIASEEPVTILIDGHEGGKSVNI
ncbi:putative kinase [Klebsiella pneumoniae]|uniref:Putative kinase n=1 Tax=Klebsiella pneumoniae TaxID=573 RepID=A0A3S4IV27_KLEPN|nr:putative kinase [Klebsiella pneumoniae]